VGEVAEAGRNVSNRLVSMGVSLTGCEVPGAGEGRDNMPGKVMFGMGIHGETGNSTVDSTDLKSSDIMSKVVGELCSFGWDQLGRGVEEHMEEIVSGDEIVVLVNNLGGTSVFEMCIVVNDVLKCFKEKGIKVIRIYSGSYMTSFDMKGVSVTALVLNGDRERIMGWLDEETECEEWRKGTDLVDGGVVRVGKRAAEEEKEETKGEDGKVEANKWGDACQEMLEIIVSKVAEKVREMESTLTSYDKITGDGDCGITVRRGVEAVEKGVKEGTVATDKGLGRFFGDVADAVGANMGGTSGGLMHIMLLSMSTAIAGFDGEVGWKEVAAAFNEAVRKMDEAGGAGRGARTMLDSIYPVCDLLESGETQWAGLAKAAREGAEGTSTMKALAGRR
jgi:dihydroxyacetone kinase